MRNSYLVILGLAGTLMAGACSSSTGEPKNISTTQVNPTNSNPAADLANSNTTTLVNGTAVTSQATDANALATVSDQTPPGLQTKMNKIRASGGDVDPAALALKNARPAPDNSTFASYLTDAGHEIRTFNNHPQLLKVEKRTDNDGKQTLKIFLRNGKVVELPGNRIEILSSASAASIAEAAGLPAATANQPAPGTTGAKKPGN